MVKYTEEIVKGLTFLVELFRKEVI